MKVKKNYFCNQIYYLSFIFVFKAQDRMTDSMQEKNCMRKKLNIINFNSMI